MAKANKIYRHIMLTPRLSVGLLKASLIKGFSLDSILVSQVVVITLQIMAKATKTYPIFYSALKGGVINL